MDYEKKYKEAIERAKEIIECSKSDSKEVRMVLSFFPELAESGEERIRKSLIDMLKNDEKCYLKEIAWLEKQGEHAKFRNKIQIGDKVTRNQDGMLVNLSQLNRVAKKDEKQGEPTDIPADAVLDSNKDGLIADTIQSKPKFKVGDWIIDVQGVSTNQIIGYEDDSYLIKTSCSQFYLPIKLTEKNYHLWTIQDAKAGDVLVDDNLPFIFKKIDANKYSYAYCGISLHDGFKIETGGIYGEWTWMQDIKPATKEQRDLLFQKMKEAGYEWDAEKKELKKVEQKPWSEEDEIIVDVLYAYTEKANQNGCPNDAKRIETAINKLKSLRPQSTWKPSIAQLNALSIVSKGNSPDDIEAIVSLYNDLKKLREE